MPEDEWEAAYWRALRVRLPWEAIEAAVDPPRESTGTHPEWVGEEP
jgi:hypothetical protein